MKLNFNTWVWLYLLGFTIIILIMSESLKDTEGYKIKRNGKV